MEHKNNCGCVKNVGCDVFNCKFNDEVSKCCVAEHINVQNRSAVKKDETFCGTFTPKAGI